MKLRRVFLALPFPCIALVLLSVNAATPGDSAGTRVLYPPAGAVVTSDPVLVMILGPETAEPPAFRIDTREVVCGLCHESGYAR